MKTFRFEADITFQGTIVVDADTEEEAFRIAQDENKYGILDVDKSPVAISVWGDGIEVK